MVEITGYGYEFDPYDHLELYVLDGWRFHGAVAQLRLGVVAETDHSARDGHHHRVVVATRYGRARCAHVN